MFPYKRSDDGFGYTQEINADVVQLGIAPAPKTLRQNLIYHICHGILMHYPLRDVLAFAWRNRYSYLTEMIDGEDMAVFEFLPCYDKDGNEIKSDYSGR